VDVFDIGVLVLPFEGGVFGAGDEFHGDFFFVGIGEIDNGGGIGEQYCGSAKGDDREKYERQFSHDPSSCYDNDSVSKEVDLCS